MGVAPPLCRYVLFSKSPGANDRGGGGGQMTGGRGGTKDRGGGYKRPGDKSHSLKLVSHQTIYTQTKKSADFSRQKNRPIFSPIFFQVVGEVCRWKPTDLGVTQPDY